MMHLKPTPLKFITVTILLISYLNLSAQWIEKNNGLYGGDVRSFAVSGTNLFAGTNSGGVFLSTDDGISWSPVNTGLTGSNYSSFISCLDVIGNTIFAGTGAGVFLTTNNGDSWSQVNSGLTEIDIISLAVSGSNIFAGTYSQGVFISTNNGASWTAVNSGLNTSFSITALAVSGTRIFAGTYSHGVFVSSNNGTSWNAVNSGLADTNIRSLAVTGGNIFAGTNGGGVFSSSDNGASWTAVNTGLTSNHVYTLAVSGSNIFAGTFEGKVFASSNNGANWNAVNAGLTDTHVFSLGVMGTSIFAGTEAVGIFRTDNNGTNWSISNKGLTVASISDLAVSGSTIFASSATGGILLSSDNGNNWASANTGLTNHNVKALAINGSNVYAGTYGGGIFLSSNNGVGWSPVNSGLTDTNILCLAASGSSIFAGTYGGGVFRSNNDGSSWTVVSTGLTNTYIYSLAISGNSIFAGTSGGGLFRSNDNGSTWASVNSGLTNVYINDLAVSRNTIFAGTYDGVFLSTNNGDTWTAVNTGLSPLGVELMSASDRNIFAGTVGLFHSNNNGMSWASINAGLPKITSIKTLVVSADNIFIGTAAAGVWSRPLSEIKSPQTITFGSLASKTFGESSFNLSATASSGLPISFLSSDPTVASINGNSVAILKAGSTIITASQGGDDIYNPGVAVQQTLTINKATQVITFAALPDKTFGDAAFGLSATANSSLPVSFATTSDKITINGAQVTIVKAGRASITASQAGNSNYEATSMNQSFCIKPIKPTITATDITTSLPILTSNAINGNQWYLNGTALTGATEQTLIATQSGTYKVQVMADDCASEFSSDQVLIVTGDIQNLNTTIDLYPNPVTDWLTISFGDEERKREVSLYQLTGQLLTSQEVSGGEIRLSVATYSKGIYIAKVISNRAIKMIKFEKR